MYLPTGSDMYLRHLFASAAAAAAAAAVDGDADALEVRQRQQLQPAALKLIKQLLTSGGKTD